MSMTPDNLLRPTMTTQKCTMGCRVLDRCLAGGISCNSITEIVAESGCGKTQLCLQLALTAQLSLSNGGLAASALYIHTEFPFPFRRLQQLSRSFCHSQSDLGITDPCDNVFVHAVHSADQLLDTMPHLESFLSEPAKIPLPVKLIVIDSIAALFRSDFDNTPRDLRRRSSLFFKISGKLKSLAKRFGLAIVVTNQVVDYVGTDEGINGLRLGNFASLYSSGRRVCAALGLAWANCVNTRLFLSRSEEVIVGEEKVSKEVDDGDHLCRLTRRQLSVVFAPHLPACSCKFVIRKEGVFGVE